jgi:predicted aspartyl protease
MALGLTALATGAMAAAPEACKLIRLAEIPAKVVDDRVMVTAKVDGVDTNLFVDTGSFFNTLSPSAAKKLGLTLKHLPIAIEIQGATGEADPMLATADSFTFMGFTLSRVDFLVAEHELGAHADGLIGENLMFLADAEFDLPDGVIRLFGTKGCDNAELAYWATDGNFNEVHIAHIEKPDYKIQGWANVNGHKIRMVLDTGAPQSILKADVAKADGVPVTGPKATPAGQMGGVGMGRMNVTVAPVDDFAIGDEEIKNTHLIVGPLQLPDADMLLGLDFFMSHRIFVSNTQNKLYFTYSGGPVFDTRGYEPTPADPPKKP